MRLKFFLTVERIWTVATKEEVFTGLDDHICKYSAQLIDQCEIAYGYLWSNITQWIVLLESNIIQVQRAGAFAMAHLALQGMLTNILKIDRSIEVTDVKFPRSDLIRRKNIFVLYRAYLN
jgi:hypothetical protein